MGRSESTVRKALLTPPSWLRFERRPRQEYTALAAGRPVACLVCGDGQFVYRPIKLNTSLLEFLNLAWADRTATGLVCATCGFVHEFVPGAVQLFEVSR